MLSFPGNDIAQRSGEGGIGPQQDPDDDRALNTRGEAVAESLVKEKMPKKKKKVGSENYGNNGKKVITNATNANCYFKDLIKHDSSTVVDVVLVDVVGDFSEISTFEPRKMEH